ncbi:DUF2577 domain-containing protein [Paenibacillus whitsoniae]|uniref:DUF2577 domain-containing protein n=1 Tax=Paenibacillus whitsoniae TaxID=2496558 RepID=UPI0019D2ACD9|nr:DUF2577 domain-containing protein [Paenibacillus whitsoniae]
MKKIAELNNLIKQVGVGATEAGKPLQLLFAKVTGIDPLEVFVDQRFALDEDFLIVPESLTAYRVESEALPEPLVIRRGLEAGDDLILLRLQGGQQFLILDRVVSA